LTGCLGVIIFNPALEKAGKVSLPTILKSSNHKISKSSDNPWFQNDIILFSLKINIMPSKLSGRLVMPDSPLAYAVSLLATFSLYNLSFIV